MCSFLAYNDTIEDVTKANRLLKRRGPDETVVLHEEGWTFVHNLLSMTGAFTRQPFVDKEARIVCFFNGEVYNWKDILPNASSDGEILIPLYQKKGSVCIRDLDGEFALALFDFTKGIVILSTDAFATKPLWYGHESGRFGLSSYESGLTALGFAAPTKVKANTTLVLSLRDFSEISRATVFDFDPGKQHKTTVDEYLRAFADSIRKRAAGTREKVFIGLSSGYDSGAIACELLKQNIPFKAYSIRGSEDQNVLEARHALLSKESGMLMDVGYGAYQKEKRELKDVCEPFSATLHPRYPNKSILDDAGAIGLGIICKEAVKDGRKVYLSGQGADEILSDYRMHGKGMTGHSTISGAFPADLVAQFPWHNFYGGAQEFYIAKEEHVAGAYGIEARYPFLDPRLVQEFLYLTPELKNAAYKYPLQMLFETRKYPYARDQKIGFIPRRKTLTDYIARILQGN